MTDLHTHSSSSDGSFSPKALITAARAAGLSSMALTDHDTVSGIEEAEKAARAEGLSLIPGVEIEIAGGHGEFHLLGLGIYAYRDTVGPALAKLREDRNLRNVEIVKKMNEAGIKASYDDIRAISGGEVVGRLHIAAFLVRARVCRSTDEAFRKFLTPGGPLYAEKKTLCLPEAVTLIHSAGGKAVVAHPLSLHLGWAALEEKLSTFKSEGIDGIEAFHSNASYRECKRLEEIAGKMGLLVTAGSDFHGAMRTDRKLGKTCDGMRIEDGYAAPFLLR
jgi:3',5'-nucleoside bisphosphate phosphatase